MRKFTMTAMLVLAATGLAACNRGAANNGAAKATNNTAAPAATKNTAAAAPAVATGMDDATVRSTFLAQCDQQLRAAPSTPAGLDTARICGCVVDATFTGRTNLAAFVGSPEGQQALGAATTQCLAQQAPGAAGAPAAGAEEEEAAEEGEQ